MGLREDSLPGGKGDETQPNQVDPQQTMKTELKAYLKTLGLKNQQSTNFGSGITESNGGMITTR